jgi:hypothetical protein
MKNSMLLIVMIFLTGMTVFGQSFQKGSQAINLDIGFWNTAYLGNDNYSGFFPSFSVSYEYGLKEIPMGSRLKGVISIGGIIGVSYTNYSSSSNNYIYLRRDIFIGVIRGNYHFIFHDKLDIYSGWWVGVDTRNYQWKGPGSAPEEVQHELASPYGGAYIGARWFFTDHIAVYSEVGWLISVVNAGFTFKF